MKKSRILPAFLISLGLAANGYFIYHAISNFKNFDRYVSVKGLAERNVKSDQASWLIQFNYTSNDLNDLYQGVAQAQNKVKDFLISQGFAQTDIEMQPVSVTDRQANTYDSSNQQKQRYIATAGVVLSTTQVDKTRAAIQKTGDLVQKGVIINQSSVNYTFTQLNTLKSAMLDEATTNARAAAESFSKNSHSHLGAIRTASQGTFIISNPNDFADSNASVMKKVRVVTTVEYFLSN